ncbi:MAG: hypothetical protein HFH33_07315 [Eubacterium sp.]|jgi:hypothetical protein|nr:hypothetical protein [Eubacterium sp.]
MKQKAKRTVSLLLVSGMLLGAPAVRSEAAVITSNATDKTAAVFQEHMPYSAGDYIIYDGEMYICTAEVQGTWESAAPHFMQITKNHALGTPDDLSASYEETKDPSEEHSLFAFSANVWQKLRGFLGVGSQNADTDRNNYKNASVSAKLNYLEEKNQALHENVSDLQKWVQDSFRSVSNGKTLIAGAITDKEGTAQPDYRFEQFAQSIRELAQKQYEKGYGKGDSDGYNRGDADGYNRGKEEGYGQGQGEGYQTGYQEGIDFADSRVNEQSESYKKGKESADTKIWTTRIFLTKDGPDKEHENFTQSPGGTSNHTSWMYKKDFPGHKILAIHITERYFSAFGGSSYEVLSVDMGGRYQTLSQGGSKLALSSDGFTWGNISFNLSDSGLSSTIEVTVMYS